MKLNKVAAALGFAAFTLGSQAYALNPDRDIDLAMAVTQAMSKTSQGMITKQEFLRSMEQRWDKMASGKTELAPDAVARIFRNADALAQ